MNSHNQRSINFHDTGMQISNYDNEPPRTSQINVTAEGCSKCYHANPRKNIHSVPQTNEKK